MHGQQNLKKFTVFTP